MIYITDLVRYFLYFVNNILSQLSVAVLTPINILAFSYDKLYLSESVYYKIYVLLHYWMSL